MPASAASATGRAASHTPSPMLCSRTLPALLLPFIIRANAAACSLRSSVTTRPHAPARAVRPALCTYVRMCTGMS